MDGECIITDTADNFECKCKTGVAGLKIRQDCAVDVAFKKRASHSSQYGAAHAGLAVDGKRNTFTATWIGGDHWWKVDFGGVKVVDEMEVGVNMRPSGGDFELLLSNTTGFDTQKACHKIKNTHNGKKSFAFKCFGGQIAARFLKIKHSNAEYALEISHVEVMGWDV